MRRLLPFATVALVAFSLGWVVKDERKSRDKHLDPPAQTATEFAVDMPDPTSPGGRSITNFTVYRVSSSETGFVVGTAAIPDGDAPRCFVTIREPARYLTYFGTQKTSP